MRRMIALVVAGLVVAGSLQAQYPGGYGPGGGTGGGMGGRHRGGGWGGHRGGADAPAIPTDRELEGPPTPDALRSVLSLSDDQVAKYQPLWAQYMSDTKAQRDSAQTALAGLHRAFDDHDREAMRQYFPVLHSIAPALTDRDKQFADKQLKPLLTKDQRKQFDQWRDEQKKAADDERRQYRRGS
jgi:hypothetical protein